MAEGKKTTFNIFLIALGITLVFVIGIWLYNLYTSTTTTSEEGTRSAIACIDRSFEVDSSTITYAEGVLSFLVNNNYGSRFDYLVVKSDQGEEREAPLINFIQGSSEVVRIEGIAITESFEAYPKGCPGNRKKYKI